MMTSEEALDLLIATAQETGFELSLLYLLSKGLSDKSLAKLCGNVRNLPKYMKSRVSP